MFDLRNAFPSQARYAMPQRRTKVAVPSINEEDRFLTAPEIAQMLGMSEWWVYYRFSKEVPPKKISNRSRWESWRVRAYIEAQGQ